MSCLNFYECGARVDLVGFDRSLGRFDGSDASFVLMSALGSSSVSVTSINFWCLSGSVVSLDSLSLRLSVLGISVESSFQVGVSM